jgi:hypothetical protein
LRWSNLKATLVFSLLLIHAHLTIGEASERARAARKWREMVIIHAKFAAVVAAAPAVKRVWVSVLLIAFYLRRFSPQAGPWLISNISDQWLAKGWMRELMMINCAPRLQLISSLPPFSIHFPQESPGGAGRVHPSLGASHDKAKNSAAKFYCWPPPLSLMN